MPTHHNPSTGGEAIAAIIVMAILAITAIFLLGHAVGETSAERRLANLEDRVLAIEDITGLDDPIPYGWEDESGSCGPITWETEDLLPKGE